RSHDHTITLGGWANPHGDPERQVDYLVAADFHAEFYLTQVVSHHDVAQVRRFVNAGERRGISLPGLFGVFYYRSANPKTLQTLRGFLPVPVEGLTREFGAGDAPEDVCARTIRTLRDAGAQHFYISNLPVGRAFKRQRLGRRHDASLRQVVRQKSWIAGAAALRQPIAEIHNMAATLLPHVGNGGFSAEKRRGKVDVDVGIPVGDGEVVKLA